jgi:hypothetical protein
MSTILKTLRKLEEEKSLLNQKLNLEEMLLKEDSAYPKLTRFGRWKFFLLIIAVLAAFLIAERVTFYRPAPNHDAPSPKKHSAKEKPKQQTIVPVQSSNFQTFEGIPMAAIPSNKLISKPETKLRSKPFTKLPSDESLLTATSPNIVEVENIIRPSPILIKKKSILEPPTQSGHISGIKIKGIIFFDNGSSSNHIIATTESNSNLKLRAGEAFQDAVVKSIHPNHVIFLHHDHLIEVAIGQ